MPVESLLRCKAVSKCWCSLIESPVFNTEYLLHDNSNSIILSSVRDKFRLLEGTKYEKLSKLDIDCYNPSEWTEDNFHISNTCDGVVCLVRCWHVFLWNPATRNIRQLPDPLYLMGKNGDPEHVYYPCALGYDRTTNNYKIVRFSIDSRKLLKEWDSGIRHQLYKMSNDSWSSTDQNNDFPVIWISHTVACNKDEMCFWFGVCKTSLRGLIFCFNLSDVTYGTLPLPDDHQWDVPHSLAWVNEAFIYAKCTSDISDISDEHLHGYHIWTRNGQLDKKKSWFKLYRLGQSISQLGSVTSIRLTEDGNFIFTVGVANDRGGVYLFNPLTKEEKLILPKKQESIFSLYGVLEIFNYNQSLISINRSNRISGSSI